MEYQPIADYGAIGNLRTVALVGLDGSIDWWCAPYLDSPSLFGAVLDHRKGGRFRIAATGGAEQEYLSDTNVLETRHDTADGRMRVIDFMPLAGSLNGQAADSVTRDEILRIVRSEGGEVKVEVEWSPRFDYARTEASLYRADWGFVAESNDQRSMLGGVPQEAVTDIGGDQWGPTVRARFTLAADQRCTLTCRWTTVRSDDVPVSLNLQNSLDDLQTTIETWRGWLRKEEIESRDWAAPWQGEILRSELALKLLMMADSGAIAAAATTSLPETIGGVRNWDYRFAWIRDASLIAQALIGVGHSDEMRAYVAWAERVAQCSVDEIPRLKVLYPLHSDTGSTEMQLGHLEGYRNSRPVNIGNEAAEQHQHDIYSDLLAAAYELHRDRCLDFPIAEFAFAVADSAAEHWRDPDYGIWEFRTGRQQFVFSKIKMWEALVRAVALSPHYPGNRPIEKWRQAAAEIRATVLEQGFQPDRGAFVMAFDRNDLDAANLQIPLLEFLPAEDPRVQGTINRTLEELTVDGLVYRYLTDDGLPGKEGAFGLCTFWMVDALALSGRLDEAYDIFQRMLSRANHVGLYSEQIDPMTGEFLGNFPQAFTHIGLINSAMYLAHADGRRVPGSPLVGTLEHRREMGLEC